MSDNPDSGTTSHALDDLLARYAAGNLPPALHALVAGHLSLRDDHHGFVSTLERSAAAFMESCSPAAITDRDGMLQNILEDEAAEISPVKHPLLPFPVATHFRQTNDTVPWRFMLPGVRRFGLKRDEHGLDAELMWIRAGRRMPSHTHRGSEYTLVLQGVFGDEFGQYRRGDIVIADDEIEHNPVASADEDCICFIVTDAPLKLTGSMFGFLRSLIGR